MAAFITQINALVNAILGVMTAIAVGVTAIAVAWAGFALMTAEANPRRVDTAKSMFWLALVGLFLVLSADAIASAVQGAVA